MASRITRIFSLIGIVILLGTLTGSIGYTDASYTSSMIAQYDIEVSRHEIPPHLDVVDLLRSKSESAIKPFENILTKLTQSEKSACDVQAELRLVSASRSFEDSGADNSRSLDAIKVLYGIRKAICETGTAQTRVPSSCRNLVIDVNFDGTRKDLVRSEIGLAHSSTIPACLRKLQEHHFFWTSYSNNLQDAGDIVHMIRSDIELHSMIMNYREFENVMLEYMDLLDRIRVNNTAWWNKAEHDAWRFFDLQIQLMESFNESFDMTTSSALQGLQGLNAGIDEQQNLLHEVVSEVLENLGNATKKASSITQDLDHVRTSITDVFNNTALEVVGFSESLKSIVDGIYATTASQYSGLAADIEVANAHLADASLHIQEILEIQNTNLAVARQQHDIADHVLAMQHESVVSVQHTTDLINALIVDTQDLGKTVSTITHLSGFIKEYEQIAVVICIFIAISIILAPLEGIVFSQRTVSHIKTTFWVIKAAIFLFNRFNPVRRAQAFTALILEGSDISNWQLVFWFAVTTISVSFMIFRLASLVYRRSLLKNFDIEKVQIKQPERRVSGRHICDSQRKRIESVPRNVRHGTTPPGF